jgi:hypothetical protein
MSSPDLFCNQCGAANTAMATTCFACGNSLSQDDPLLNQTGTTSYTSTVSSPPPNTPTSASPSSLPAILRNVFAHFFWSPPRLLIAIMICFLLLLCPVLVNIIQFWGTSNSSLSSNSPEKNTCESVTDARERVSCFIFVTSLVVSDTQIPNNSLGNAAQLADCAPDAGARYITAGPDRALWFTESCSDKIGRITTQGSITQFTLPTDDDGGINVGSDGAIWFEDGALDTIGRITPQGSITQFALPVSASGPLDITTGPDGALWFIEDGKIGRITTKGSITEFTAPS